MVGLKKRILDIAYKNKLSHLGSYLSSVDIIDEIYNKKSLEDKVNLKLIVNNDIFIRIISKEDVSLTYLNWLKNDEIMKFTEQNNKNHTLESTNKFVEEKLQSKFDFLFGIFLYHMRIF